MHHFRYKLLKMERMHGNMGAYTFVKLLDLNMTEKETQDWILEDAIREHTGSKNLKRIEPSRRHREYIDNTRQKYAIELVLDE